MARRDILKRPGRKHMYWYRLFHTVRILSDIPFRIGTLVKHVNFSFIDIVA